MKFTSLLICFLLSSICYEVKAQSAKSFINDSIIAITVSRNLPQLTNEGKLVGYELQSTYIFFNKNWILYKIPYNFYIHKLSDSGIYEIDKIEKRTRYLIHEMGDSTGFFTDSSLNLHFLKCPVDSVIPQFWPIHQFMESSFDNKSIRLIDSLTYRKGRSHYSAYSFKNKEDTLQKGTYRLEFSDSFPTVNYSISPTLDIMKGMKLTSIEIFNESRYLKEYNITIDAVKQNRKITLLKDFNISEIAPFFKYMKKKNTED